MKKKPRPNELECIVLKRDLPEFGLHEGDIGTVVDVHKEEAFEVEFFDREGDTHAILTLLDEDVRLATERELKHLAGSGPEPWPPGVRPPVADATSHSKV